MKHFDLEANICELEAIERSFREPDLDLERAIVQQERAEFLAAAILKYLSEAETKLEVVNLFSASSLDSE